MFFNLFNYSTVVSKIKIRRLSSFRVIISSLVNIFKKKVEACAYKKITLKKKMSFFLNFVFAAIVP